jgi:uncharacterized protein (DUF2062 family)
VANPIRAQLSQGCAPEKIALAIAVGTTLGVFPVIGLSTALCTVVAFWFRLNQPVIQLVNYALYPLQIALLIGFVRFGEHLFGAAPIALSPSELMGQFRASPMGFAREFAMTLVHGITGWLILSPVMLGLLYGVSKPLVVAASNRLGFRRSLHKS